jgi:acyl dehydratase
MGLNRELVGKEYEPRAFDVTAEGIERYARATNDDNRRYRGPDAVASPVWPVVPAFGAFMAAAKDPDLGANMRRLVHAAEEHLLHLPIRAGDRLDVITELESVEERGGGEAFTVAAKEINQNGDLAAEVRATMFIRGRAVKGGLEDSSEPSRAVVFEQTMKVDDDQTQRYAEASGDHNPIHLDKRMARLAGLPRIINHGMCTMAMAVKGAVDGLAEGDPARVKRVKARFSKPVFPGQEITTRFRDGYGGGTVTSYEFETLNPSGARVIDQGIVEVLSR